MSEYFSQLSPLLLSAAAAFAYKSKLYTLCRLASYTTLDYGQLLQQNCPSSPQVIHGESFTADYAISSQLTFTRSLSPFSLLIRPTAGATRPTRHFETPRAKLRHHKPQP